jgi:WD40 repeat protein
MSIPNPYVGPRAFKTGEKLYGRDMELRDLLDLLIAERIVLLYSPSGAGKSSLIQAGLVPELEEESFRVLPTARVNLEPPTSLAPDTPTNRYVLSVLLSLEEALTDEQRTPLEQLASMRLDEYLDQCPKEAGMPDTEVLVFDQYEEILSLNPTDQDDKAEFFSQVGAALRNRKRWALFSMREDYVAALDPYIRAIPTRLRNTFRLDRLEVRAARQAIQQPARQAEVAFEDEAAQLLVDDLRRVRVQKPDGSIEQQLGIYVEPVQLQVVCYRLWENRDEDSARILAEDVKAIGDVDSALADYYAERVAAASDSTNVSQRIIRDWFDRQLITEQGIRSQVLMGTERSGGLDNRVIRMLENAHLVRTEKRGGATWFELAHDRLIEPVRQNNLVWMQENLSLLQRTADVWNRQERPDSLLLREDDLGAAEAWASEHQGELLPHEVDFINASQEAQEKERQTRAMAEQAIQLEAERKRAELQARLTRIISAVGVLAVVLAIIAGFLAVQSSINAQEARSQSTQAVANASTSRANEGTARAASTEAVQQKNIADAARVTEAAAKETALFDRATAQAASTQAVAQQAAAETNASVALSRRLASLGLNYLTQQPTLALLFDVEAFRTAPTFEALSALFTGLQRNLNRRVELFGRQPSLQEPRLYSVAFSPDGRKIAWSGTNGIIAVWDVQEQRVIRSWITHGRTTIYSVVFSPDGDILASGGADGKIFMWDSTTFEPVREFQTQLSFVLSLAFSPDGTTLASSGVGRRIFLWDVPNNRFLRTLSPPIGDDVWSLAWSPDGEYLASGGADELVRLWDPQTGQELDSFPDMQGIVLGLAWSPDSALLAIGGENQSEKSNQNLYIWDVSNGDKTALIGHTDRVLSVAFAQDGNVLASGGADNKILLWDVIDREQINQISDRTHWIVGLAFNPEGEQLLAAVGFDHTVNVYTIITEQPLSTELTTNKNGIQGMVYGSDSTLKIGANQAGTITLWDVDATNPEAGGDEATNLEPALSGDDFITLALSQDRSVIALGTQSGDIEIRDTATDTLVRQLIIETGPPLSMAISPDNRVLAIGVCRERDDELEICTQNEIERWNIDTGVFLDRITTTHTDEITRLAFDPQGLNLASGSKDHTILLWNFDAELDPLLSSPTPAGSALTGHLGEINSLAFSPINDTLASADENSQVMLWDTGSLQLIGEPTTLSLGALDGLAFSLDGRLLAIGSRSGTVLSMDIDAESWTQRACELAGRNFTAAEWKQFLPDQAYRPTCSQFPLETPTPNP